MTEKDRQGERQKEGTKRERRTGMVTQRETKKDQIRVSVHVNVKCLENVVKTTVMATQTVCLCNL